MGYGRVRLTSEGSFHGVGTSIEGPRGLKGIDDALKGYSKAAAAGWGARTIWREMRAKREREREAIRMVTQKETPA